jgi:hypothetical protein
LIPALSIGFNCHRTSSQIKRKPTLTPSIVQ